MGPALLILDLNMNVGDLLQAFLTMRTSWPHTFYLGFASDQNEASYVQELIKTNLAEKYAAGQPLPSGEKLDLQVPTDILEALPAVPRMNLLVPGTEMCNL